jgi:hypothetical protein
VLRVKEYFLFDPFEDYLDPPMQGYRLRKDEYVAIRPVEGRLPSQVVGLHLERSGSELRLWNPKTGLWLPTPAENQVQLAEALEETDAARRRALAENERLRREIEALRRQSRGS